MDRALASAFFVVTSETVEAREFVIYETPAAAAAAEATGVAARGNDQHRALSIATGEGDAAEFARVALTLLGLSARRSARARAALAGETDVYGVPFALPPKETEEGQIAMAELAAIMNHFSEFTYASRLVISADVVAFAIANPDEAELVEIDEDEEADEWVEFGGSTDNVGPTRVPTLSGLVNSMSGSRVVAGADLLSRYFLNGDPEVAEVAAEPAQARPVLAIPWGCFVPGPPRNCLIEGIIAKYSDPTIPPNRRLGRATVTQFFEKTGPSLEALRSFAETYRIPLRVYDISGAEIMSMRVVVAAKSGSRRGLGVLAYNGHAYFRDGSIAEDPKLQETLQAHDLQTFIDTRSGPQEAGAVERDIQTRFLEWAPLNKTWKAERFLGARALVYSDQKDAGHICEEGCACGYQGWDMSKAYHTAVKKDFRAVGIPVAREIPIFTAVDDWVVAGTQGSKFPGRGAWARTYFLVRPEVIRAWNESGVAYLAGRVNNLLTGPEFEYLHDAERISPADVAAWKTATDSIATGRYEHFTMRGTAPVPGRSELKHLTVLLKEAPGRPRTLPGETVQTRLDRGDLTADDVEGWTSAQKSFGAFLDELDGPAPEPSDELGGLTRAQFSVYHGLFGRSVTRPHSLTVSAEGLDAELLTLAHRNVEAFPARKEARVELSKGRDLLMNTRSTYDYIVASTNLVMMKLVDEVVAASGARVVKLRTDGVVFDRRVELPAWAAPLFHPERVRVPAHNSGKYLVDAEFLVGQIAKEIGEVVEKIVGYVGAPGTGKTHAVKANHKYDEAMAFSNITARNLDGEVAGAHIAGRTLDEGLRLQSPSDLNTVCGRARGRTWWIDEISTIKARVWSVIVEVASRGLERLILTGDPNQIPPIMEKFRGDSLLISAILSRAQRLTHDYRNDAGLVDVRNRVLRLQAPGTAVDPSAFVSSLHAAYPVLSPSGRAADMAAANVHITHTRAAADRINRWIAATRGLRFVRSGEGPKAQHTISAGVRLRSCENFKDAGAPASICNGDVFELVEAVTPESRFARLRPLRFDAQAAPLEPIEVPAKFLHAFALGWAFTTHSTIGITVRGQPMCIYEAERMVDTDPAILYTAVTRACLIESVIVAGNVPAHIPFPAKA